MNNFKEIAEKCLAGELSGTFVTAFDNNWHSSYLQRYAILGHEMPEQYVLGPGVIYNKLGQCESRKEVKIIDFIPDNMQKQIKIDIPEGKVPVMEQAENGVVITWKEKELTYNDIIMEFGNNPKFISNSVRNTDIDRPGNQSFYKKVEVLRKLINIRNYFGGDKPTNSWIITIDSALRPFVIKNPKPYRETCFIYFDTQEHAQMAINMLGDELKHLFEPW
jgi:hypothetical protein